MFYSLLAIGEVTEIPKILAAYVLQEFPCEYTSTLAEAANVTV